MLRTIKKMVFCGVLTVSSALVCADSIKMTVETDHSVFLAGQKNTAYVRVGLTGTKLEQKEDRTPVNLALVIDRSGSMEGEKLEKAKQSAIMALSRLRATDIASVVIYDDSVEVLVPATKMTDKDMIAAKIRQVQSGGSTALHAGVTAGAAEVKKFLSKEYVNRVVLLSDGLANVGPQSTEDLGRLGSALLETGISVTTIGLGLDYNEDLMSKLAAKSDGGHYFAENADKLTGVFDAEFGRAMSVVAQDARVRINCGEGIRPVRVLGRDGQISDRAVTVDINHIYSDHEKYVILEVELPESGNGLSRVISDVSLSYQDTLANKAVAASTMAHASFSDSQEKVDASLNKSVLADAVEQIAILTNEQATTLRDAGQVEEARRLLISNTVYLRENAVILESSKLQVYGEENKKDSENLDEQNWNYQKKSMRENQQLRQKQR